VAGVYVTCYAVCRSECEQQRQQIQSLK